VRNHPEVGALPVRNHSEVGALPVDEMLGYVIERREESSQLLGVERYILDTWLNIVNSSSPLQLGNVVLYSFSDIDVDSPLPSRHLQSPQQSENTFDFVGEAGLYNWKAGEVYVNFANDRLGGGLLDERGWVQEEILSFCSTIFPLLVILRLNQQIITSLLRCPRLFSFRHIFDIRRQFYGGPYKQTLRRADTFKENWVLRSDYPAADVHRLRLPAINRSRPANARVPYDTMIDVAIKGFYQAIKQAKSPNQLIIHTGHWGGGAFENSQASVLILQCWALHHCIQRTKTTLHIILHYHDLAPIFFVKTQPK